MTDIDAPTGGVQKQTFRLLEELERRGVPSFVCARNYHRRPRYEVRGLTTIRRSPVAGRSLAACNSALYIADTLAWLIRNRQRYDVLHCQQMFGSAVVGLLARALVKKPVLVRVTASGEIGEVGQVRKLPLATWRVRQLRRVDRWVALTKAMSDEIATLGIPRERIVTIPNATVVPEGAAFENGVRRRARARLGFGDEKIAVYCGRLSEEKGLDVLLHAWAGLRRAYTGARLLMVGAGGPYRNVESALRALVDTLDLRESVRFCGHVDGVDDYLLASDAFVLPTRSEGMSNALVEAMASGTPIVTTGIPANLALVEHEVSALLVAAGDAEALGAAIDRLFSQPALGVRLGRRARAKAEGELSLTVVAERYLAEYRQLVGGVAAQRSENRSVSG